MNVTKQLYQWDTGQKLTECTGIYVDYLIGDEVYRVEITDGTCIIPDELLQTSGRYKVWECMADNTLREFAFKVLPRPIPPNYVFTPTEQLTFEGLVQKETNKFNTNAIEKLNAYNANADNRVAEFNAQTEQIQTDVSELKSDLTEISEIEHELKNGYIRWDNGSIQSSSLRKYLEFPITKGLQIIYKYAYEYAPDYYFGLAFYDVNGVYIIGYCADRVEKQDIFVPENAILCRATVNDEKDIVLTNYNGAISFVYDNVDKYIEEELNVPFIENTYVSKFGGIVSEAGYKTSELFALYRGQSLIINSKDPNGESVATISKWEKDGTFLEVLVSGTTDLQEKTYTATDIVEYVRVCVFDSPSFTKHIRKKFYKVKSSDGIFVSTYSNTLELINDTVFNYPNDFPSVSMFEKIATCGDSYTAGQIYRNDTQVIGEFFNLGWGKNLGRLNGVDVNVYASSGADTNNWQTRNACLPKLLSDAPSNLYIFALGINDSGTVPLGTITDIHADYTTNPNTFYGNYGKIIEQTKNHAPNSKIILSVPLFPSNTVVYTYCADALKEIAEYYEIGFIDTKESVLCNSEWFIKQRVGGHPTAPQYSALGKEMTRLINKCIQTQYDYFKDYVG